MNGDKCRPAGVNIRPAKVIFFHLKVAFLTEMWPAIEITFTEFDIFQQ
jgi:hypothetical protein